MGRGKLKMEMIEKEKKRSLTFHKRKQGLFKKMHEFTTLCSVPACIIVYDPSNASTSVWPENSDDEVRRLVDAYKSKIKAAGGGVKSYGLPDFFSGRRKEIEGELAKLRKNKYPTWDDRFSAMDEFQLRNLGAQLRIKAQNVRIQLMRMRERERERERERVKSEQQFYINYLGLDFLANNAQIPVNVQSYYQDLPPPLPLQYYPAVPENGNYLNYDSMAMMDGSAQGYHHDLPPPTPPLPLQYYPAVPEDGNYLNYDSMAMMDGSAQGYYHDMPPLQYYPAVPENGNYLNYDSMAMMDGSAQGYWVEEHPWQWQ